MIPESEWLDKAKQLAVGMRTRTYHNGERRPNLAIGNDLDKWWCYCHACHEGGVVEKSHVMLGAEHNAVHDGVSLPRDIKPVYQSEFEIPIARFLADKNMSDLYLPDLYYSEERKRLMLQLEGKWHGRDLTGRSPQKWMNYSGATYIGHFCTYTAVVEDIFSRFKVRWAMRQFQNFNCVCNLGTNAQLNITYAISQHHPKKVAWFFDADPAGDDGADNCIKRNRALGISQYRVRPPEGLDPKDMTCEEIRAALIKEMQL